MKREYSNSSPSLLKTNLFTSDEFVSDTAVQYTKFRIDHWNSIAHKLETWSGMGGYYQDRLLEVYRYLINPGKRVLEIGCGFGDLLAEMKPARGVGIDFSPEMVRHATDRHPEIEFLVADAHSFILQERFDYIILSDLINDVWNVQVVFRNIRNYCTPHTRIILNSYSRLWELPLSIASKLHLAKPNLPQNWLTMSDVRNLLYLENYETIRTWQEVLWPIRTPILDGFFNRYLVKIFPFRHLALTNFLLARPVFFENNKRDLSRVSVIVPARNEEGNIQQIFERVPEMGAQTEIVFIEGNSQDNTFDEIKRCMTEYTGRQTKLFKQTGKGKGDAVRLGFSEASGDILMILDADLTVPPERLPDFYLSISSGKGEFVNGVRLVYPLEGEAMQFANLLGNKFFSGVFSWLLGQPVKDTLCGTKVLWKSDYKDIEANRSYFGDFDPFGDFDLLFGASKLGLKIVDLPVRYQARMYGSTNIKRWKHGAILIRMVIFAVGRIKFI
jgi:SAM-dependent methyltransferase